MYTITDSLRLEFSLMANTIEIVVPTYGSSPYLSECLKSIVDHTDPNSIKCTILDDCTPGNSIEEIVRSFPNRFHFIKNEMNLGLAANFQKAIDISTSDYTIIIGSDDRIAEKFIESILDVARLFPDACLIHPRVRVIDRSGNAVRTLADSVKTLITPQVSDVREFDSAEILRRLLVGDFMYFPSIAWKTEIVQNYRLNTRLKTAVDLDLLLRLAITDHTFVLSHFNGFEYRRHSESISSQLTKDSFRAREELLVQREIQMTLKGQGRVIDSLLAFLAPSIRLHALMIKLRMIIK